MARPVQTRRQGQQVFYRIESDHVGQLIEDAIFNAEHASGGIPEHHEDSNNLTRLTANKEQP